MGFAAAIGPVDLAPGATVTTDPNSTTLALPGSQLVSSGDALVVESLRAHGAAPAHVTRGPFDVSQWESLQFTFTPFGGAGWGLGFDFWGQDSPLNALVGSIQYGVPDQTAMVDNIPVLGPFVTITTVATVANVASLVVIPRRGPGGSSDPGSASLTPTGGTGIIMAANGIAVAVGGFSVVDALHVTSGEATLTIRGTQAFLAVVNATDRAGTTWEIGEIYSTGAAGIAVGVVDLRLPGTKVAVVIINLGAGAGAYNLSLVGSIRR